MVELHETLIQTDDGQWLTRFTPLVTYRASFFGELAGCPLDSPAENTPEQRESVKAQCRLNCLVALRCLVAELETGG